ncbi:MAG: hypothetical protein U0934_02770 [Pseudotabrizicola sp.]|uniref:hypothetical protein n=1 Tax=Pseudotabrizicola sp. TaxID=2939647 RepID=UPI00271C3F7D|nr:hypothetical protein [Pseudotabrizicola sp.]MDO8884611.1 hypothetical protein [Pseudotabrizicola sp.]MDP2083480.1 hypothetical protein [Pseudotabrizicola sp.]MDZ7572865.1 hypothetical protein [Pseudotabrizicola sp.]
MTYRLPILCVFALAACVPTTTPQSVATVAAKSTPSTLHSFTIDRAFTLSDPRELAFRDQIAAEARQLCGFGDFSLFSSRPVGFEVVRDDFIYRQHEVQITCDA